MDVKIVDFCKQHFSDVNQFTSGTGVKYICGTYNNISVVVSVNNNGGHIVTKDDLYMVAAAQVNQVLDVLDHIVKNKKYPISDITRFVAMASGNHVAE